MLRYNVLYFRWLSAILLVLASVASVRSAGAELPASGAEPLYGQAREAYYRLGKSKALRAERGQWLSCIEKFNIVQEMYPETLQGYKALFTVARLYYGLNKELGNAGDLDLALAEFKKVSAISAFKQFADDALYYEGEIFLKKKDYSQALHAYKTILHEYADGDQVEKAKKRLDEIKPRLTEKHEAEPALKPVFLQNVIYRPGANGARVVVETSAPAEFKGVRLVNPDRYFLNFADIRLAPGVAKNIEVKDEYLERIRLGIFDKGASRVVLDIKPDKKLEIASKKEDGRIVIDIREVRPTPPPVKTAATVAVRTETAVVHDPAPAMAPHPVSLPPLAPAVGHRNPVPVIVIDAGHGGKDEGAKGESGLLEKDVNLQVAKLLKDILEKQYKYKVVLTRDDDTFLSLDKRGDIANENNADLFVSIHTNAAPRSAAKGIETYYLGIGHGDRAEQTAARENGDLVKSVKDDLVQNILTNLLSTSKINESSRLAGRVQNQLYRAMSKKYPGTKNLGVKEGPFFVLHHAYMPSILVEVGFITNEREQQRLTSHEYLNQLAASIGLGIREFMGDRVPSI